VHLDGTSATGQDRSVAAPDRRRRLFPGRIVRWIDDLLPISPVERRHGDWVADGQADARRKQDRLKLHMLEKRGKGGYR
jgi:hypothetical protein